MKRAMYEEEKEVDDGVLVAGPPAEIAVELAKAYRTLPFVPENLPRLILISGKYDTGKDTLANTLQHYFKMRGMHVQHEKFADALKEAAAIITGERKVDQYTDEGKARMIESLGMTIGRFQQVYGTVLRCVESGCLFFNFFTPFQAARGPGYLGTPSDEKGLQRTVYQWKTRRDYCIRLPIPQ